MSDTNLFKTVVLTYHCDIMSVKRVWGVLTSLFDFMTVDATLKSELSRANLVAGVRNFLVGILIFLVSSFALAALSVVYLMLVYDATSAASLVISAKPAITTGFIVSSLVYFGLITLPFLFIGSFIQQGVMLFLMRLVRGKGTYAQQYFMSSYIALALGVSSLMIPVALVAGIFLPCVLLFFGLVYLVMVIYLGVFVQAKILMAVHNAKFVPSLAISLLVFLCTLLAYLLLQLVVTNYGLGPNFTATFGMSGMNTTLLSMNATGLPNLGAIHIGANSSTAVINATNSTG